MRRSFSMDPDHEIPDAALPTLVYRMQSVASGETGNAFGVYRIKPAASGSINDSAGIKLTTINIAIRMTK